VGKPASTADWPPVTSSTFLTASSFAPQRLFFFPIGHPNRLEVNHFALANHHRDTTSDLAVVHETLHEGGQLLDVRGRDADLLGFGGR
jgi:hypothetical protein